MLIPRYWSRAEAESVTPEGDQVPLAAWGSSMDSPAEADELARANLQRIVSRIRRGEGFPDHYGYGERLLREEILQEFSENGAQPSAVITRNSYGVLVLNTARVAFIDVDLPARPEGISLVERLARWLLRRVVPPAADPAAAACERLDQWLAQRPERGVRVYRTRSGLRYLLTHATYSPDDPEIEAAMQYLGADPQYRRLCRVQKSFRARLTPKPWRCDLEGPPYRFPWTDPRQEQAVRAWQEKYERATQGFATCCFVQSMGNDEIHADVDPIIRLHDAYTRALAQMSLA